jgi:tetratricopeptide (TPR) repeat protein
MSSHRNRQHHCAILLIALLGGCAGQPGREQVAEASNGDRNAASQLYAGQPAVVHATEFPVASAAEGIQRGDEAWRAGKFDLAIYLYVQALAFEFALERQPDDAAASERLGLLYLQSARDTQTQALFERAVSLQPNRWRSHNGLGILADRRRDFAAAIGHYDRALEIEPKAAPVMNNRGYSRFLAGDPVAAETDLKEAIRLGASDGAWTNLGKVQASQARYEEALQSFLQTMDLPHAYNLLGEAAMEGGDYIVAQRYFTTAISASPRYFGEAQKNLALVNERLAKRFEGPTMKVRTDSNVYSKGVVIGKVRQGLRVPVLATQNAISLIRFRDGLGTDLVGWIPTSALEEHL